VRETNTKPYDTLYAASPNNILWATDHSHLLRYLKPSCDKERVLDVGCGDGANALFLERAGYNVHGIDISALALSGLRNRFAVSAIACRGQYEIGDVHCWYPRVQKYSALVSCGLFQCLQRERRGSVHRRLLESVVPGGIILFSALTNLIPLPEEHLTPGICLADLSEVKDLFAGMSLVYYREGTIKDRHGNLVADHEHSVVWVAATRAT